MPHATETPRSGTLGGGLCSLAFWLCLFAAAVLYGLVALSSKLVTWETLESTYQSNHMRLVELERQVARVRRFIGAQQNDPEFLREQARSDFELTRPNEERIPVESHLTLQIGPDRLKGPDRVAPLPIYVPLIREIARSRSLSDSLLAAAAALVIGAFALFPARRSAESTNDLDEYELDPLHE